MAEIERLYQEHYREFANVARGIVGTREAAHDAVQERFAGAIRSRRSFPGEGPIEAWVWRSVVNAALNKGVTRHPMAGYRSIFGAAGAAGSFRRWDTP